jgi:hypothetical protein
MVPCRQAGSPPRRRSVVLPLYRHRCATASKPAASTTQQEREWPLGTATQRRYEEVGRPCCRLRERDWRPSSEWNLRVWREPLEGEVTDGRQSWWPIRRLPASSPCRERCAAGRKLASAAANPECWRLNIRQRREGVVPPRREAPHLCRGSFPHHTRRASAAYLARSGQIPRNGRVQDRGGAARSFTPGGFGREKERGASGRRRGAITLGQ